VTFFLMISVLFFSCYLLFFDTSFLEKIGVFNNEYILIIVCGVFVIVNMSLFLIHISASLVCDTYFAFSGTVKMNLYLVLKATVMYFLIYIEKTLSLLLFILPAVLSSFILNRLYIKGTYFSVIVVSGVSAVLLSVIGLYYYSIYKQKYQLVPYYFFVSTNHNLRESFRKAYSQANGKCHKLLFMKIFNFPKRLLSLLIFPAVYFLPVTKTMEYTFLLQNEKPYMRKKAYTEKAVVFYFKPLNEN
ncbi:MAG: hypothetical protein IKL09_02365, partial [Clostridia bacterium]|nr:hypothetical protein [Clostridia bacterium]